MCFLHLFFFVFPLCYVLNLSVVFDIFDKVVMALCKRCQTKEKQQLQHTILISQLSVMQMKCTKSLLMDGKNSVASTTASSSRHCLAFFGVVKAGPHDYSFQSRNLRQKRCTPETLFSFLRDCTACPTTSRTLDLFLHTFQQNSAANNNTLMQPCCCRWCQYVMTAV